MGSPLKYCESLNKKLREDLKNVTGYFQGCQTKVTELRGVIKFFDGLGIQNPCESTTESVTSSLGNETLTTPGFITEKPIALGLTKEMSGSGAEETTVGPTDICPELTENIGK